MAGQAIYSDASASSNQDTSSKLAINQPSPAVITESQTSLPEQSNLTDDKIGFLWGVEIGTCRFGSDEAKRLAREGVIIGNDSTSNYVDLVSGNILFTPEKDTVIATCEGKVSVGAGANVFVAESSDNVIIYDLLQTTPKQVSVKVGVNKQKIVMEPGRVLVLTKQNSNDFEKLETNCHCVAYRNAKLLDLHSNQVKAFEADFSIASALLTIQPLKELTASNNKQDKLAMERLVKGAVLLGDFATSTNSLAQVQVATAATVNQTNTAAQADAAEPIAVATASGK